MMMRPGDILGRIFYVVTEINHRIIGIYPRSTRRTRIIGIYPRNYFGSCFARNLWGKSSLRCCFARNISNYLGTKIFKQKS